MQCSHIKMFIYSLPSRHVIRSVTVKHILQCARHTVVLIYIFDPHCTDVLLTLITCNPFVAAVTNISQKKHDEHNSSNDPQSWAALSAVERAGWGRAKNLSSLMLTTRHGIDSSFPKLTEQDMPPSHKSTIEADMIRPTNSQDLQFEQSKVKKRIKWGNWLMSLWL